MVTKAMISHWVLQKSTQFGVARRKGKPLEKDRASGASEGLEPLSTPRCIQSLPLQNHINSIDYGFKKVYIIHITALRQMHQ